MSITNRLNKHFAPAAVATAAVAMTAAAANASVVNWNSNLVIPGEGLYINVETQAYSSDRDLVPGYDINPFFFQDLYWSSPDYNLFSYVNIWPEAGGVTTLSNGTLVDGFSNYSYSGTSKFYGIGAWVLNSANNFGFRFLASDNMIHYGYGIMTVGANYGECTLTSVFYESDAGVGITVGSVPAPGAFALLGLAGFAGRRRRS